MLSSDKNLPLKEELLLFSSMKNSYIKQNSGSGTKTTVMTKGSTKQDDAAAKQWIADAQLSSRPSSFRWSRSSSIKKKNKEQLYVLEDGYLLSSSSGVEEQFDDKDSIVTEIVKNTKSNENDSTSSETIRTEIVKSNNIFDDAISVLISCRFIFLCNCNSIEIKVVSLSYI